MEFLAAVGDAQTVRGDMSSSTEKRFPSMHDLLIAGSFVLMVLLPCIVTMKSGATEESED